MYIYFAIALIFFLLPLVLVKLRMRYLNLHPEQYLATYDGHEAFLDIFFLNLSRVSKKVIHTSKQTERIVLHLSVRIAAKASAYSEKIYTKNRNKFMESVVKDKKAVPYFWDHLKKYKKEIDQENRAIEEDKIV